MKVNDFYEGQIVEIREDNRLALVTKVVHGAVFCRPKGLKQTYTYTPYELREPSHKFSKRAAAIWAAKLALGIDLSTEE